MQDRKITEDLLNVAKVLNQMLTESEGTKQLGQILTGTCLEASPDENELLHKFYGNLESLFDTMLDTPAAIINVENEEERSRLSSIFKFILDNFRGELNAMFTPGGIEVKSGENEWTSYGPDDMYPWDLVWGIGDRIADVMPLVTTTEIDPEVFTYLDEAIGAYRFGLERSAVVLAHAAVEYQLKLAVFGLSWEAYMEAEAAPPGKNTFPKMLKILGKRVNLPRKIEQSIRQLSLKRNSIVHKDPVTEEFNRLLPVKLLLNQAASAIVWLAENTKN